MRISRGMLPALLAAATMVAAPVARAQGTVSGQGFGYPPGQLGTRATSMGGGVAEHDPESSLNPAALGLSRATMLFFQYAPEFRTVEVDGRTVRTTALRFPSIGGYARLGERARLGLSVTTLLDRTYQVARVDTETVASGDQVFRDRFRAQGGVSDVRFAGSWLFGSRLHVGAGVHAVTGENRIEVSRNYGDTLRLPLENRSLSFSGGALSAGVALQVTRQLNLAGSLRRGADLRVRSGDTLLARARVPDRFGAGLQYTGITGTTLAVRSEYTAWSNMRGLGSPALSVFDTWELGAGADVTGPKLGSRAALLRAGARWRELPFGVEGSKVTELELGGGLGFQLPFERATADFGVRRAARSAAGIDERAWTFSFGVSVRP